MSYPLQKLVRLAGFEPTTPWFVGSRFALQVEATRHDVIGRRMNPRMRTLPRSARVRWTRNQVPVGGSSKKGGLKS